MLGCSLPGQRYLLSGSEQQSRWPQLQHLQPGKRAGVSCQAKRKGQAYYEKYKANRARHEGVLLPPLEPGPGVPHIDIRLLEDYLNKELWAYTFGLPSPFEQPTTAAPAAGIQTVAAEAAKQAAVSAQSGQGVVIPPPPVASLSLPDAAVPTPPVSYDLQQAQVYVFWDLGTKHPGMTDPRVTAHRLKQLAAAFGQPQGLYAYAVRKDWNWVPQHFLQYRSQAGGPSLKDQDESGWGFTCSVCGVRRRTAAELDSHMRSVHPVFLPSAPNSSGGSTFSQAKGKQHAADSSQSAGKLQPGVAATAQQEPSATALSTRNTSRRTLGKVQLYHTALGAKRVPPAGHQLSLKYCLSQEGWEARIVQNAAEAESVAVMSGLGRLLDRIRRGQLNVGVGGKVVVLLVSEDEARLQQALVRLRGVGGAVTVAVRSSRQGASSGTQNPSQPAKGARGGKQRAQGDGSRSKAEVRTLTFRGADLVVDWDATVMKCNS